jgi:hypothetical protein
MATTTGASSGMTLNDLALFRQACYLNGVWVQARSGATIEVDNPATGAILGTVPKLGATKRVKRSRLQRERFQSGGARRQRNEPSCCAGGSI